MFIDENACMCVVCKIMTILFRDRRVTGQLIQTMKKDTLANCAIGDVAVIPNAISNV